MNCERCKVELEDFLYGELAERLAAEVRQHLAGCDGCTAERGRLESENSLFAEFYEAKVDGEFKRALGHDGDTLTLLDAAGTVIDRVEYSDRDPWPSAADGVSASLERITPRAPGPNW